METIISVDNLTKKFGSFTAVNAISFQVKQGEIFGFLGANGAGKTTAMKILIGISRPTSGQVTVAGHDIYTDTERLKKSIGYMSQRFSLYNDLTIRENIEFFGGIYGLSSRDLRKKAEQIVEKLSLQDKFARPVSELPLGWKQKLAFSVAMLHNPKIVFLDEPTGGVDPATRRVFWNMIYEAAHNGVTIFVTTHYMDEAEYCDRISMMVDGKIEALDTPSRLKEKYQAASMNEVFLRLARKQNATP